MGKSKVMWCSRYGNGGRMHVILNGEPLEEMDCFEKFLRSSSCRTDLLIHFQPNWPITI